MHVKEHRSSSLRARFAPARLDHWDAGDGVHAARSCVLLPPVGAELTSMRYTRSPGSQEADNEVEVKSTLSVVIEGVQQPLIN